METRKVGIHSHICQSPETAHQGPPGRGGHIHCTPPRSSALPQDLKPSTTVFLLNPWTSWLLALCSSGKGVSNGLPSHRWFPEDKEINSIYICSEGRNRPDLTLVPTGQSPVAHTLLMGTEAAPGVR